MNRNNESVQQLIKHVCGAVRTGLRQKTAESDVISPLLNCVSNVLKQMDKCSIPQARAFLAKALEATVVLYFVLTIFIIDEDCAQKGRFVSSRR